jgi:hypothetical protein
MFVDRAEDSRITGIREQAKRVPEAKGGLQRAGADVRPPGPGVRMPSLRPEDLASGVPGCGAAAATISAVFEPINVLMRDPGRPLG